MKSLQLVGRIRHVLEMLNAITDYMLAKGTNSLEDVTMDDLNDFFNDTEITGNYTWRDEEKQAVAKLLAIQ